MLCAWNNEEVIPTQLSRVPVVKQMCWQQENDRHVVKWSCTMHSWKCVKCHCCFETRIGKATEGRCTGEPILFVRHGGAANFVEEAKKRGHSIWLTRVDNDEQNLLCFCTGCGSYAQDRMKAMLMVCPGAVRDGGPSARLQRILNGKHPTKSVAVGKPWRLTP